MSLLTTQLHQQNKKSLPWYKCGLCHLYIHGVPFLGQHLLQKHSLPFYATTEASISTKTGKPILIPKSKYGMIVDFPRVEVRLVRSSKGIDNEDRREESNNIPERSSCNSPTTIEIDDDDGCDSPLSPEHPSEIETLEMDKDIQLEESIGTEDISQKSDSSDIEIQVDKIVTPNKVTTGPKSVKLVRCPECFETFENRTSLLLHIRRHGTAYPCEHCLPGTAGFKTSMGLHFHKKRMHPYKIKLNYKCQICSRNFKTRKEMNEHKRNVHVTINSFQSFKNNKESAVLTKTLPRSSSNPCSEPNSNSSVNPLQSQSQAEIPKTATTTYKCHKCFRTYPNFHILAEHFNKEHDDKMVFFICKLCNDRFEDAMALKLHTTTHGTFCKCTSCHASFSNIPAVSLHHARMHPEKYPTLTFHCNFCPRRFASNNTLHRHCYKFHGYQLDCVDTSNSTVISGEIGASEESPFICIQCGKKFKVQTEFNEHMYSHMEQKYLKCPHCSFHFQNQTSLKFHISKTHSDQKKKDNKTPSNTQQSERTTSLDSEKLYICPKPNCEANFTSILAMDKHITTHELPLKCSSSKCHERFLDQTQLKAHIDKVHRSYYSCPHCNDIFVKPYMLSKHLDTHGSDFICRTCYTGFNTHFALKVHTELMHPTFKPDLKFHCGYENCGQDFLTMEYFQIHYRSIHPRFEDESLSFTVPGPSTSTLTRSCSKPNKDTQMVKKPTSTRVTCHICKDTFSNNSSLNRHTNAKHRDRETTIMYNCTQCTARYKIKQSLEIHMTRKHSGTDETNTNIRTREGLKRSSNRSANKDVNYLDFEEETTVPMLLDIADERDCDEEDTCNIIVDPDCQPDNRWIQINVNELTTEGFNDDDRRQHTEKADRTSLHVKRFQCSYCNASYKKQFLLQNHIHNAHSKTARDEVENKKSKSDTRINRFGFMECDLCDKKIAKDDRSYSRHYKLDHQEEYQKLVVFDETTGFYRCTKCQDVFFDLYCIDRHIKSHGTEFMCDKCSSGFRTIVGLKVHLIRMHPSENKHFKFHCCGQNFTTRSKLQVHWAKVHKNKNHESLPLSSPMETIVNTGESNLGCRSSPRSKNHKKVVNYVESDDETEDVLKAQENNDEEDEDNLWLEVNEWATRNELNDEEDSDVKYQSDLAEDGIQIKDELIID